MAAIDQVISVTLNPLKNEIESLSSIQLNIIEGIIEKEKEKLQKNLKSRIFKSNNEKEIELFVSQYHSTLILLLQQVYKNKPYFNEGNPVLSKAFNLLVGSLDELLVFIEERFAPYLSLLETVPITYLEVAKNEIKQSIERFKNSFLNAVPDKELSEIVLNEILKFIETPSENSSVTFKEVIYMKDLVKELEHIDQPENPKCIYTALVELLVYLNYNSKLFINHFTSKIKLQINSLPFIDKKIVQLEFKRKEFQQMHVKPGVILNPEYNGIKAEIERWFTHEIYFVSQELKVPEISAALNPPPVLPKRKERDKVLCMLTGDQIGLFLRASDQNRLLIAPSMTAIFKAIVPSLSTKDREELSVENTRVKSYEATDHDKETLIMALEKLIQTIREF
ncbi:hypothetical protein [Pedobacter sp. WC2423]|uniref:hypothetical protein n=1 Tax=Pedobacter sp. WC2423 TaxID=3234142 RepID=UPI0034673F3E